MVELCFPMALCTKCATNFISYFSNFLSLFCDCVLYPSHPCFERHLAYIFYNTPDTPKWGCQRGVLVTYEGGVLGSRWGVSWITWVACGFAGLFHGGTTPLTPKTPPVILVRYLFCYSYV